jgi:hypothetical protein
MNQNKISPDFVPFGGAAVDKETDALVIPETKKDE